MACFLKRNLKTIRYVVEDDGGVLHIASERQLLLACLKPQERLELSHSRGVQKPLGRLHPVHAPCSAEHFSRATSSRYAGASNTKLDIIVETEFAAPTAAKPSSPRLSPGLILVQSLARPINLQARQLQRHLRRSAFNRCRSPSRLERRGSYQTVENSLRATSIRMPPWASHPLQPFIANRRHGVSSRLIELQSLRLVRPGLIAASLAAARNAGGATLHPP